jgi:hypothetical protein
MVKKRVLGYIIEEIYHQGAQFLRADGPSFFDIIQRIIPLHIAESESNSGYPMAALLSNNCKIHPASTGDELPASI